MWIYTIYDLVSTGRNVAIHMCYSFEITIILYLGKLHLLIAPVTQLFSNKYTSQRLFYNYPSNDNLDEIQRLLSYVIYIGYIDVAQ